MIDYHFEFSNCRVLTSTFLSLRINKLVWKLKIANQFSCLSINAIDETG